LFRRLQLCSFVRQYQKCPSVFPSLTFLGLLQVYLEFISRIKFIKISESVTAPFFDFFFSLTSKVVVVVVDTFEQQDELPI
jgi:hypothetical protein